MVVVVVAYQKSQSGSCRPSREAPARTATGEPNFELDALSDG